MEAKSVNLIAPLDAGVPDSSHFTINTTTIGTELKDGEVLVDILVLSADPYLRGRIKSSAGAKPGSVMQGFVAGKIIASKNSAWSEGALFGGNLPFQTRQVVPAATVAEFWPLPINGNADLISYGIGVLGMPGATAFGGLVDTLRPKAGEVLFVSAAAGAVGSLVGQIAKKVFGCIVIGTAGGPDKCKLLTDKFGFDFAIDYKKLSTAQELIAELTKVAPKGIDMYFENVGGIHFEAAVATLKKRGRIAVCGAISAYNDASPTMLAFPAQIIIYKSIRIEGFISFDWLQGPKQTEFLTSMSTWLAEGKLVIEETFFNGIESWPVGFAALFHGTNVGKVVIRV